MFKKLKNKIINLLIQNSIEQSIHIEANRVNYETFHQYKDFCVGKELVICGAGPTLVNYQPISGAIHIAVNRAFLYNKVKFDFVFAQDFDGIRMVQEELKGYETNCCVKFFGHQFGDPSKEIPEELARDCAAKRFFTDTYIYHNGFKSKFVVNIDQRPIGNMPNVGLSVLQLALFMRPKTIYIVGCDMSGAHFINKNQSNEQIEKEKSLLKTTWSDNLNALLDKWLEFKMFANKQYPSSRIVCVNPVALKGMFEDLYQNEIK